MTAKFALLLATATLALSPAAAQVTPATAPTAAATTEGSTPRPALPPRMRACRRRPLPGDIPARFVPPVAETDFVKREVMIPMRDGTKLYTVIVYAKGLQNAPIRPVPAPPTTPRAAATRIDLHQRIVRAAAGRRGHSCTAGYIRVYQDIRGKYGSEGDYIVTVGRSAR